MNINDEKQIQSLAQRILTQAGWKLGGLSLAEYLDVSEVTLSAWLAGKSVPPTAVILRAVQLLNPETGIGADIRTAAPPAE